MGEVPHHLDDPTSETGYATADNHPDTQLKYLRDHHRSMAKSLVFSGLTPMQLANLYGFVPGQISRIIGSPLFQAEVARLRSEHELALRDLSEDLRFLGRRSVETLTEALYADETKLPLIKKLPVAFDVLDRLGFGKKEVSVHQHKHLHAHTALAIKGMETKELLDDVMDILTEDESS